MRRVVVGITAVVTLGVVVWAAVARSGSGGHAQAAPTRLTAQIERRDLVDRETLSGKLGYAGTSLSLARRGGTVTTLAPEGSRVVRGETLYKVDEQATRLLYGRVPVWREMSYGSEGRDVRQLERNLVALGYGDSSIDIDGEFDSATWDAVEEWEDDLGLTEDGVVALGDVEFQPGPRRVGAQRATIGASLGPGSEVLETTSTEVVVTLDLEAERQYLVASGDPVVVTMPDGTRARGRITQVGRVAKPDPSEGDDAAASDPTVEVTISVTGADGPILDQASVDVAVEKQRVRGALAVPIAALLALAEGGYALEVIEGSSTELVAVKTGLYAGGWVEIEGEGLEEGVEVVVPE